MPADSAEASTQSQDDVNSSGSGSSPTSAPVATRSRTVIRGVQRPPVVSEITPSGVLVPSGSAQTQPARRQGLGAASAAAGRFAAAGVQRPDVLRGQKAAPSPSQTTAAPLSRSQKAASASAFAIGAGGAGARATVARPGVGVPKPRATAVRPSGLKAPTRFGAASESGASGVSAPAPALPRPASRLPALAGVGRGLRGKANGSGNTTGTKKAM
ncbi:hypothetical protein WOLCODRAFT_137714 [Wolfiporia cocos MD-104 SS10]|uniref:Uncharacterized protein n=1 Tax=Wolfiporia cocos (strain MD-104) TaxID=742152 RepID=A0A2H3JJT8_WOLCO|nr:hypothetical protein WOLCODRAFT_137714 [Wolfiporia cocos MD-104 SS10]